MAELKKIRVRTAKSRDIGLFKKLWLKKLEQEANEGSIIVPSEQSLSIYENLFNSYVEEKFEGIVLFVADKGVLLWGDAGMPVEYTERVVTNWGYYVDAEEPEAIEEALFSHAREWASEKGFKSVLVQSYGSEVPEGYKVLSTLLYKSL